jgi:hypothetical protein
MVDPEIDAISDLLFKLNEKDRILEYSNILRDTSYVCEKLMQQIEELKSRLEEERKIRKETEAVLSDYKETANSNINKHIFNTYVMAAKDRPAKRVEWAHFVQSFSFSEERKLHAEIYKWVDKNIT